MAIKRSSKRSSAALIKVTLMMIGFALFGYIIGPPLYWNLTDALTAAVNNRSSACSPCICDCSSQPLFSFSEGLSNTTFPDCSKHDSKLNEDRENNFSQLLSEELKLHEAEAVESQRRADMALLEAKKLTSQYQKEADKCNSGMETCEQAREEAEAALVEQRKLTAMWEHRAHQNGWREGIDKFHAQSEQNT